MFEKRRLTKLHILADLVNDRKGLEKRQNRLHSVWFSCQVVGQYRLQLFRISAIKMVCSLNYFQPCAGVPVGQYGLDEFWRGNLITAAGDNQAVSWGMDCGGPKSRNATGGETITIRWTISPSGLARAFTQAPKE